MTTFDFRKICHHLAQDYTQEITLPVSYSDMDIFQDGLTSFRREVRQACRQMPQEEGLSVFQSVLAGFSFLSTTGGILCKPTLHCNDPSPAEKAQAEHLAWMSGKA